MSPVIVLDRARRNGWTLVAVAQRTGIGGARLKALGQGRGRSPTDAEIAALDAFDRDAPSARFVARQPAAVDVADRLPSPRRKTYLAVSPTGKIALPLKVTRVYEELDPRSDLLSTDLCAGILHLAE